MAMVSLLIGRRPREDTAIFADLNCYGFMSSDRKWAWDANTIALCQYFGVRRALLGKGSGLE